MGALDTGIAGMTERSSSFVLNVAVIEEFGIAETVAAVVATGVRAAGLIALGMD